MAEAHVYLSRCPVTRDRPVLRVSFIASAQHSQKTNYLSGKDHNATSDFSVMMTVFIYVPKIQLHQPAG
jgi:hypothetical protein